MSISALNHVRHTQMGEALNSLTSEPEQADVDFFNAAMQRHAVAPPGRLSDAVAGSIGQELDKINGLSEKANRALKKESVTGSPLDTLQMGRSLSEYYLQSSLTAKVVNKGSQALDKLTNMQ